MRPVPRKTLARAQPAAIGTPAPTIEFSPTKPSQQKAPLLGYAVQVLPEDSGDMSLSGIQCFLLQIAERDVATAQPGDMVTLKGTCDGQVLGQVKISKCVVVK